MKTQPQSFYQLNQCVIEHFRATKVQLEILDQLDSAGGEGSCEDILTSNERRQEVVPLEENGILRRIRGKGLEISPTGRAIICSYREWKQHLYHQRLIMQSQDLMREIRLQELAASVDSGEPVLQATEPEARAFMDGAQWCTAAYARKRYGIRPQQLNRASAREKGFRGVIVTRKKAQVRDGKRGQLLVYHTGDLQRLADALDREE